MSSASPPPPPDYSALAAASEKSAQYAYQLGQDQLTWAKEQYSQNRDVSNSVIDAALGTLDTNNANAAEDRSRYQTIFQPLEEQLAVDAQNYASPQREEQEAGRAEAAVSQTMETARNAAQQKLEAYGVKPGDTRMAALDYQSRIAGAAAQAGAGNQARQVVDDKGRALRSEAINVGRGYPGQIAQEYGTATQAGNQGVNAGLATTASGAQSMGTAPQWQGLGNQAIAQWGNILNTGYQNQLSAYQAQNAASSGIGGAVGAVGGLLTAFMKEGGVAPPANPVGAHPSAGQYVPPNASPTGGAAIDDVPARLNAGEFVVPKDVVGWKGEEFFQKLIMGARKQAMGGAPAQPQMGAPVAGPPAIDTTR